MAAEFFGDIIDIKVGRKFARLEFNCWDRRASTKVKIYGTKVWSAEALRQALAIFYRQSEWPQTGITLLEEGKGYFIFGVHGAATRGDSGPAKVE